MLRMCFMRSFNQYLFFLTLKKYKLHFSDFFKRAPLLYLGINLLIGISFFLFSKPYLILIFLIFNLFFLRFFFLSLLIFSSGYFLSFGKYSDLKKIDSPMQGSSILKINSVKKIKYFNKTRYVYRGTLKSFKKDGKTYKNIPISLNYTKKLNANYLYQIEGEVIPIHDYYYILKTKKPFYKLKRTFSLAEVRYKLKSQFFYFLKKKIKNNDSLNFLKAIILGETDRGFLSYSFSKVGISHILAISGFHFGILVIFFAFFLRLFFSSNLHVYILLVVVNVYFLFVGSTPSIQRAYLMINLVLISQLINRRYFPINALGAALFISLLLDPLKLLNAGFQLSYLSCFSIFLIFPIIEKNLNFLIKKRTKREEQSLDFFSQKAYMILKYLKSSIALSLAINLAIFPVILFHFHIFSFLSFIYNLFIPLSVCIIMFLLIITLMINLIIPPIASVLFDLTSKSISLLLSMISQPPVSLQYFSRVNSVSSSFVIFYLVFIFSLFIFFKAYFRTKKEFEFLKFF